MLVRETSRSERARGRALFSAFDVAYNRSFYGFSCAGHEEASLLAKYLLCLLHSAIFEYFTLMTSGRFGVEREVIQVLDVCNFPFIPPEQLSIDNRRLIEESSFGLLANQPDWKALDNTVARIYGLAKRDQDVISDTLATRSPFPGSVRETLIYSLTFGCPGWRDEKMPED